MDDQSSDTTPHDTGVMDRADLLSGIVFVLVGLGFVYFSWTMDRLEIRGINPATVPGLVPGLLGAALALTGAILAGRSLVKTRSGRGWGDLAGAFVGEQARRVYVAAGLALIYALVLVGLVPFWLATGLFVFAFIVAFELWLNAEPRPLWRSLAFALIQAAIVAALITLIFERGFLVRLP